KPSLWPLAVGGGRCGMTGCSCTSARTGPQASSRRKGTFGFSAHRRLRTTCSSSKHTTCRAPSFGGSAVRTGACGGKCRTGFASTDMPKPTEAYRFRKDGRGRQPEDEFKVEEADRAYGAHIGRRPSRDRGGRDCAA